MLADKIYPKSKSTYATHIPSRNGATFKTHGSLGAAKGAITYHHRGYGPKVVFPYSNLTVKGLYRWEGDHWKLIFVAHGALTKAEVSDLLKCIKG